VLFSSGGLSVMNLSATIVLAFSMSADAFAAALGKGATLDRPRLGEALRVGLVFGTVEAITPVIGWAGGLAASPFIAAIDHWIAFALLAGIGGKMIWDAARRPGEGAKPARHSLGHLLITALGTSLDAMAVGVTLALLAANIVVTAFAIGSSTFVMTTIGIIIGRVIGEKLGRIAEALGGIGLILIGTRILIEHTLFGS
jgi:manganese efflux pump family protein